MTMTGAPPLRVGMLVLGVLLLARAMRVLSASGRQAALDLSPRERDRVLGATVWCSVRVCRRYGLMRRRIDHPTLATRLAVAPTTWPARAIKAAARRSPDSVELTDMAAGVRLMTAAVVGLAGAGACFALGPTAAAAAWAGGAAAGSRLPDLVMARASRAALRVARRSASGTVDVLAAAVSAGLPLGEALELTAGNAPPALAAACRSAATRLRLSGDPVTSLATEADHFGLPVLADVGEAAERERRLGIPLGPELRQIAARVRSEERAAVLTHAARWGPLGTLVVALVIAPVCLAALTACLVGGLVAGGTLGLR